MSYKKKRFLLCIYRDIESNNKEVELNEYDFDRTMTFNKYSECVQYIDKTFYSDNSINMHSEKTALRIYDRKYKKLYIHL